MLYYGNISIAGVSPSRFPDFSSGAVSTAPVATIPSSAASGNRAGTTPAPSPSGLPGFDQSAGTSPDLTPGVTGKASATDYTGLVIAGALILLLVVGHKHILRMAR